MVYVECVELTLQTALVGIVVNGTLVVPILNTVYCILDG
jgi:hypothetical protein